MLAGELHHLLSAVRGSSTVLVFIRRPGAYEPEIVEVAAAADVSSEDAFVLYVDLPD